MENFQRFSGSGTTMLLIGNTESRMVTNAASLKSLTYRPVASKVRCSKIEAG